MDSNVVTLAGIRGVHNSIFTSGTGFKFTPGMEVLEGFVSNMKSGGISNYYQIGSGAQLMLVLCPEHAAEISASQFSKADIQEYIFYNDKVWSYNSYYETIADFIEDLREIYKWDGVIDSDCGFFSPSLEGYVKMKTETEKAAESMMEIIDSNSSTIPEGDYLKMCDILGKIRKL